MNRLPGIQKDMLATALLIVVAVAVYWPALAPGRTFLPADLLLLTQPWHAHSADLAPGFNAVARPAWDPLFQFYPARKFLADSLLHGNLPLWNPRAFSGTPFAADGQTAVFYPINWLYAVLPLAAAFGWVAFLHTLLTGIFFYLFGRQVGWSRTGSTAGSICWMLCGVLVAWQMWQVVDSALCWLPLALYFLEGWRTTRSLVQIVGLAIALGLSLLAGHLQFAFYVWLMVAAYGIYRICNDEARSRYLSALGFAASTVMGVGVAAVQLMATAGFLHESLRSSAPYKDVASSAVSVMQLPLLLIPEIFGGQRDWIAHPFIAGNYYETVIYCGAAATTFAFFGLQLSRRGDLSRFWAGVIVFALLMACGSPMYALFYYGVPLYKSFHGLSRICVLLDFSIAALCAQGVTRLAEIDTVERRRPAQAAAIAAVLLVLLCYRLAATGNGPTISRILTHDWIAYGLAKLGVALLFSGVAGGMLVLLPKKLHGAAAFVVAGDMLWFACGINVGANANLLYPPTTELRDVSSRLAGHPDQRVLCLGDGNLDHAQSRLVPNSAMALGWNDVSGSDPLILGNYDRFVALYNRREHGADAPAGYGTIADAGSTALDLLNATWILSPVQITEPAYKLVDRDDIGVYMNTKARGAGWLTSAWAVDTDSSTAMDNLFAPGTAITVDKAPSFSSSNSGVEPVTPITFVATSPGLYEIDAATPRAAVLVTSMVAASGWQISDNGRLTSPLTVDGLLTGLPVAPGPHRIVLHYLPETVWLGLYITLVAWLTATAVTIASIVRPKTA